MDCTGRLSILNVTLYNTARIQLTSSNQNYVVQINSCFAFYNLKFCNKTLDPWSWDFHSLVGSLFIFLNILWNITDFKIH